MQTLNDSTGQTDALLSAAAEATDLRTRSELIGAAAAARMAALGQSEAESAVPALEDVMDDPIAASEV